ncbi:hypothetical protein MYP_4475 [Sporocytophaga myxococcoides]|uniref:Uncharacterized protein n=1 Tax=Sporocytophaga myxococcoides TaxID=153721 RepID=A0A098LJZ1_9BACT|nr:hypothetical protein MYP_4475 [Sporocytophaga myxococcoides]
MPLKMITMPNIVYEICRVDDVTERAVLLSPAHFVYFLKGVLGSLHADTLAL